MKKSFISFPIFGIWFALLTLYLLNQYFTLRILVLQCRSALNRVMSYKKVVCDIPERLRSILPRYKIQIWLLRTTKPFAGIPSGLHFKTVKKTAFKIWRHSDWKGKRERGASGEGDENISKICLTSVRFSLIFVVFFLFLDAKKSSKGIQKV